ncbi:MAG TPA: hypothetical protein VGC31_03005 [Paenirhodobacter sp.]
MTTLARRVQAYEATLVPLSLDLIGRMHALTIAVGWPHRAEDLALLLQFGEGVLAVDPIGRAIGSAMWFRMGEDMASLGMQMTVPLLQSSGLDRWMMEEAMAAVAGRRIRMVATRESYHLDYSMGFRPAATLTRYQGHLKQLGAPVVAPAGVTVRAMTQADLPALVAIDAHANGGSRRVKLMSVAALSRGIVAERDGAPIGFALCRRFGRGHLIGPLEAETPTTGAALLAELLRTQPPGFLRIDMLHDDPLPPAPELTAILQDVGLSRDEYSTVLTLGAPPPVVKAGNGVPVMYAMMSQSLG